LKVNGLINKNNENKVESKISKTGSLAVILLLGLIGSLYQNLDEIRSNLPTELDEHTT